MISLYEWRKNLAEMQAGDPGWDQDSANPQAQANIAKWQKAGSPRGVAKDNPFWDFDPKNPKATENAAKWNQLKKLMAQPGAEKIVGQTAKTQTRKAQAAKKQSTPYDSSLGDTVQTAANVYFWHRMLNLFSGDI